MLPSKQEEFDLIWLFISALCPVCMVSKDHLRVRYSTSMKDDYTVPPSVGAIAQDAT